MVTQRFERAPGRAPAGLFVHFQVIVDLERSCVYGVEALGRTDDQVPISVLIRRSQEEGWYDRLELALLELGMEAAESFPTRVVCTLNLSASAITKDAVRRLIHRHRHRRWGLEVLEFSSRMIMGENFRQRVRELNCDLLVDDAGTGNSDVRRIHALAPTIVKIDRQLMVDSMDSCMARARLDRIIDEARTNGSALLAEGIETKGQLDFARSVGCRYAQGYYFNVPGPVPEVLKEIDRIEEQFARSTPALSRPA